MNTAESIVAEIRSNLKERYDLVFIDQVDQLTDEQVEAIVDGDNDKLNQSILEWESESIWSGAHDEAVEVIHKYLSDKDVPETSPTRVCIYAADDYDTDICLFCGDPSERK